MYLCRRDQGRGGAWVWVGVEDAEKLHNELKARGVKFEEFREYLRDTGLRYAHTR